MRLLKDLILTRIAPAFIPPKDRALDKSIYSPPFKKISFCTTCMGRLDQLQKTYLKSIKYNEKYPNIEFVLVNYNSKDNLDAWARKLLSEFISKGIVNYFLTKDPNTFHMSKAKNLSHRLATGEILVNLDADNFAGENIAFFINHQFKNHPNIYLRFKGKGFRFYDTAGKVAVQKSDFEAIGGYDESFGPMKYQDIDFYKRLDKLGVKRETCTLVNFLRTVKHNTIRRAENIQNHNLKKLADQNKRISEKNLKSNIIRANSKGFQTFSVYKNFSNNPSSI